MQWLLLLVLFCAQARAQLSSNKLFRTQGKKVITTFTGETYQLKQDLLYYIPASIDLRRPTTVVFYLHGGNSNMTQERSTSVADTIFFGADTVFARKEGMKQIADALKFIVVMPTTTRGWNDFTPTYLRDLLKVVRQELNPHPEKIFLSGHSMGAMGICRAAGSLADEFAMFLPVSGGFQPHLKIFAAAGSLYNTKVWVTVGDVDYQNFKTWNEDFEKFVHSRELQDYYRMDRLMDWTYERHAGSHNPNIPQLMERFKQFLPEIERKLYQPNLFGSLSTYYNRYFWLEALNFRPLEGTESGVGIGVRLYSGNNRIEINLDRSIAQLYDTRPHLEKLRLHLSEKLFNLNEPIEVTLVTKRGAFPERSVLFKGLVPKNGMAAQAVREKSQDKGFKFEAFLDLTLPRN